MGLTCSKEAPEQIVRSEYDDRKKKKKKKKKKREFLDPHMRDITLRSVEYSTGMTLPSSGVVPGQSHLLYKQQKSQDDPFEKSLSDNTTVVAYPTRLMVRRRQARTNEEGNGCHIYCIRYPADQPLGREAMSEQSPEGRSEQAPVLTKNDRMVPTDKKLAKNEPADHLYCRAAMTAPAKFKILDWVTISDEHKIYCADVGLSEADCDQLVAVTEKVCRGQYAAYTYAKQTLGCREFPILAHACQDAVHTVVAAIMDFSKNEALVLDDREPHMVKYDVTKKERQKLDMHTDKSEWTFLVALSNGCGLDYDGGGTYFECLDATVHIQRGHALIFPGKLRHCGQRITSGLRFLLVGFLVDKTNNTAVDKDHISNMAGDGVANIP